ncbi:MAG: adenosylcobalamin-dependent ribonucleoside-diphosphate reductase [Gammaproteobacteria bacterium]|nr:adenosylcobalamin-dependent ribonucleoside-diphosphate reductase [Gammaproteobacteria bacterium]
MQISQVTSSISELIWKTRYRFRREADIQASWQRVAQALASIEANNRASWERRFLQALHGFRFLPGGRILAGAGTGREMTLCNCFVMGRIEDDLRSIFKALEEGALTMQQGGGVGYDFSTLRPAGLKAARTGSVASGPVSFMRIWDSMCATLLSTANRRGAMMGTLRCEHPDIRQFIDAKRQAGALRNFNLSVLVSDAFMQAIEKNKDWSLLFPCSGLSRKDRQRYPERLFRDWPGSRQPVECAVMARMPAAELWEAIMRANYDSAEPGVLFIDRINQENNLGYREQISATNPCGEIPLPAYGACDLGSINLASFVQDPFDGQARLDLPGIVEITSIATRMLDNVIDLTHYPLPRQREQAQGSRRIGLGITGLADALLMLQLDYRSEAALRLAREVLQAICHTAYRTSIGLAREKGGFPFLQAQDYLASPFIQRLPEDIRQGISRYGIRNSHLIAIAPAGTISLLAGNVSSGIEPVFDFHAQRRIKNTSEESETHRLTDPALALWHMQHPETAPPDCFVSASDLSADQHLAMQAALQPHVDNAVSKTLNVPRAVGFAEFQSIYRKAWELGLKGCTTFRPNPQTASILSPDPENSCCPS